MTRPRLGFFTRLGIVLSLAWIVGAGAYRYNEVFDEAASFASARHAICMEANIAAQDYDKVCGDEVAQDIRDGTRLVWQEAAYVAFAPLVPAWILGIILVFAGRWVWRGRAVA